MTRWKITVEYDGGEFCGWQRQPDVLSVQQVIEEAIEKFSTEKVLAVASGRTDAGVHARGQVVHFDLEREAPAFTIRDALNAYIRPHKICVTTAEKVDRSFHARFSTISRTYHYRIINRRAPLVLDGAYAWHILRPLNIDLMKQAATLLIGHHDFTTFRAKLCQATSPLRTLERLDIRTDGPEIRIETEARSFLYHQVRNMVGSLSLVGSGRWTLEDFRKAFAACDRSEGGPTAPPHGLCFWKVRYDDATRAPHKKLDSHEVSA